MELIETEKDTVRIVYVPAFKIIGSDIHAYCDRKSDELVVLKKNEKKMLFRGKCEVKKRGLMDCIFCHFNSGR